jgi:hypothetical protein
MDFKTGNAVFDDTGVRRDHESSTRPFAKQRARVGYSSAKAMGSMPARQITNAADRADSGLTRS